MTEIDKLHKFHCAVWDEINKRRCREAEPLVRNHRTRMCLSLWWCGGTRTGPWSRRCRSWSRDWWASGRYSGRCCCVRGTAGFSSLPCESPSSTGWWCARPAAAHSPPCGWTRPECDASDGRSNPHLLQQTHHVTTHCCVFFYSSSPIIIFTLEHVTLIFYAVLRLNSSFFLP